ncbi:unnamed protein product [Sphagnum balticum]
MLRSRNDVCLGNTEGAVRDGIGSRDAGNMESRCYVIGRWLGPFRVAEVDPQKGTCTLEEFGATRLRGAHSGSRLGALRGFGGVGVTSEPGARTAFPEPGSGNTQHESPQGSSATDGGERSSSSNSEGAEQRISVTTRGVKSRQREPEVQRERRVRILQGQNFAAVLD